MKKDIELKEINELVKNNELTIKEAIKILRKKNAEQPNPITRLLIGEYELIQGNKKKAIQIFKKLVNESSDSSISKKAKEFILIAESDSKLNINDPLFTNSIKSYHNFNVLNSKDKSEKREFELKNNAKKGENPFQHYRLAMEYIKEQKFNEARICASYLLKSGYNEHGVLILGKIEYEEGNSNAAYRYFSSLVNSSRCDVEAKVYLGKIALDKSNYRLAMKYFEETEDSERSRWALMQMGTVYHLEGFYEESLECYRKIDQYDDLDLMIITESGVLSSMGNYNEARELICDISISSKYFDITMYNLALNDLYEGKYMKAMDKIKMLGRTELGKNARKKEMHFLKSQLGIAPKNIESLGYFQKQVYNYDQNAAIEHIKLHLLENDSKRVHTVFYDDIDIEKLYYEISSKIIDRTFNSRHFLELYIIKADYPVAMLDGEETNYIEAKVVPGTKNIISMYPAIPTDKYREMEEKNQTRLRKEN